MLLTGSNVTSKIVIFNFLRVVGLKRKKPYSKENSTIYSSGGHTANLKNIKQLELDQKQISHNLEKNHLLALMILSSSETSVGSRDSILSLFKLVILLVKESLKYIPFDNNSVVSLSADTSVSAESAEELK